MCNLLALSPKKVHSQCLYECAIHNSYLSTVLYSTRLIVFSTSSDNYFPYSHLLLPSFFRSFFSIGMLYISVIDSGAGISTENQKKLFKEVIQFNPEKLQSGGGSGFGLYICKGIVDLHEGFLAVFSEGEGLGSTFTVQLPMEKASNNVRLEALVSSRLCRVASDLSRSQAIIAQRCKILDRQSSVGSVVIGRVMNNMPHVVSHRKMVESQQGNDVNNKDENPQVTQLLCA